MAELGPLRRLLLRAEMYNIQLRYIHVAAEFQVFFRFAATWQPLSCYCHGWNRRR